MSDYITLSADHVEIKAGPGGQISVDLWGVDQSELLPEVPSEIILHQARDLHSWAEYLAGIDIDDILGAFNKEDILTWVAENASEEELRDLVPDEDEDEEDNKPRGPVH